MEQTLSDGFKKMKLEGMDTWVNAAAVSNGCSTAGASNAGYEDDLPQVSGVGKEMSALKFFDDARQRASSQF